MNDKKEEFLICSMTGFGKGSASSENLLIEVEIKTVNNRFMDLYFKAPRCQSPFEADVRNKLSEVVQRGRVDFLVKREVLSKAAVSVEFNQAVYDSCLDIYQTEGRKLGLDEEVIGITALSDLMNRKDVLESGEAAVDDKEEKTVLLEAMDIALKELISMRREEGSRLAINLSSHFSELKDIFSKLSPLSVKSPEQISEKIREKIESLSNEIKLDEGRLASEVAFIADRLDVTEEKERLESHFGQLEAALTHAPAGRKIEFLLQEINREFNTIGSKSQDAEMQALVVEAKCELEKMREQALNIE